MAVPTAKPSSKTTAKSSSGNLDTGNGPAAGAAAPQALPAIAFGALSHRADLFDRAALMPRPQRRRPAGTMASCSYASASAAHTPDFIPNCR